MTVVGPTSDAGTPVSGSSDISAFHVPPNLVTAESCKKLTSPNIVIQSLHYKKLFKSGVTLWFKSFFRKRLLGLYSTDLITFFKCVLLIECETKRNKYSIFLHKPHYRIWKLSTGSCCSAPQWSPSCFPPAALPASEFSSALPRRRSLQFVISNLA